MSADNKATVASLKKQSATTRRLAAQAVDVMGKLKDAVEEQAATTDRQTASSSDIMRYAMYFKYYKMEKEAMRLYGRLDTPLRADACRDCEGHCERGCPHQRAVREGLLEARSLLT